MYSALETARRQRGRVPEWDDTYIEKYVPKWLLDKMMETDVWCDEDGFHWGFCYMFASKIHATKENVVVVATKPHGQGVHELKIVASDQSIQTIWDGELVWDGLGCVW